MSIGRTPAAAESALPEDRGVRLLRALALGAAIVGLTSAAHLSGGGALPAPATFAAVAALSGGVSAWLTRRRCGAWRLGAALGLLQLGLHAALSVSSGAGYACAAGGGVPHGRHAHLVCEPVTGAPLALPDHLTAHVVPGAGMLVAHLVATVLTAWLVARGEAVIWRAVRRLLPVVPATTVAPVGAVHETGWPAQWLPARPALVGVHGSRAPPAH